MNHSIRIHWLDVAKGFAILLVVLGRISFLPTAIRAVIYSFHMPLFFFLSGFLLFRKEERFGLFLKKKAKTLLWPYYCFLLIQFLVLYFPNKVGFDHAATYSPGWSALYGDSELWFLLYLFVIQVVLFPILNRGGGIEKKSLFVILGFMSVVFLIKGECFSLDVPFEKYRGATLPFKMDLIFLGGSFVVLGILLRNYLSNNKFPLWLIGVLLLVAIGAGTWNYYISGKYQVEFFECFVGNPVLFYISSIASILVFVSLCQRIRSLSFVEKFGRYSLSIYAMHWVVVPFVDAVLYRFLVPIARDSILFKSSLALLSFIIVTAITFPIVHFIEKKLPWILGRF